MIGTEHDLDGGRWRVVGADGGAWILERLDEFEPPRRVAPAELAAEPPASPDEVAGWEALAAAAARDATDQALIETPEAFAPPDAAPPEAHAAFRAQRRRALRRVRREPTPEQRLEAAGQLVRVTAEEARRAGVKS